MKQQEVIQVLDRGATNVRAITVNWQGETVACTFTPNASNIVMENSTWHQWFVDIILQRFADFCRQIHSELDSWEHRNDVWHEWCSGR